MITNENLNPTPRAPRKPRAKRGTGERAQETKRAKALDAADTLARIYRRIGPLDRNLLRALVNSPESREIIEAVKVAEALDQDRRDTLTETFNGIDARKG